ncbi:MAG: FprA family A-type flavoprotein [Bacteroidales bacterium]|nr:FprA family A-type flavoprotein [Bacteroidales bacterium]
MVRKISDSIVYIGTDDYSEPKFESQYAIPDGMAYNSYLIKDKCITVLDSCDKSTSAQWRNNLLEALGEEKPDYFVLHHLEPDHSSDLPWILEQFPSVKLVASAKAIAMVPQFFPEINLEGRTLAVKEGDSLELGAHTLHFYLAPMVHWPEVIVSYESREKVLFSADAFGKFGGLERCGFDSTEDDDWACEARRYYFNIVGKYGGPVQTLLKKLSAVEIATICPLHGPVLKDDLSEYLNLYNIWSSYGVESEGVFVACASIHGNTLKVAEKFADMLRDKGVKVAFNDLTRDDQAEAVEDAFRYGTLVLAASSYDAGLFPPAVEFISHLQDKSWQNRRVGLIENGSWAPTAGRVMKEKFSAMKNVTVLEPMVTIKSALKDADIPALEALAEAVLA